MATNFMRSRAISSLRRDPAVMLGTSSMELSELRLNFDHSKAASDEALAVNEIKRANNRLRTDGEIIGKAFAQPPGGPFQRQCPPAFCRHRFSPERQPGAVSSRAPSHCRHFERQREARSILPVDEHRRTLLPPAAGARSRGCEQRPRYARVLPSSRYARLHLSRLRDESDHAQSQRD